MSKCDKAKECMCSARKSTMKFLNSNWDAKDKSMVVAIAVMVGIIVGLLLSSIKGGICSNNKIACGNTAVCDLEDDEDDIEF